jgi:hypothetical protein
MSLPNPINVTYVSPQIGDTFPFVYIVKDTDNIVNIDTTNGEVHVILRNIRNSGILQYQPLLAINDGGNNAETNNITIYPSQGDIINDSTSYVINTNGANTLIDISNINQWVVSSSQSSGGGGGTPFSGTNWLFVYAKGTDIENAAELKAAYDLAKTMSPSGSNRISIYCASGYYNFQDETFEVNESAIDIVSLDGNASIKFNSSDPLGTISIITNNVYVRGVDVSDHNKRFLITNGTSELVLEKCKGGEYSFGYEDFFTVSGTFINCEGLNFSFGGGENSNVNGTFIGCKAGTYSFGGNTLSNASGTFTDCISASNSFGSLGEASGVFINCIGDSYSFGGDGGIASGSFTNCKADFQGFSGGVGGLASGFFKNCVGNNYSFGSGSGSIASGTFIDCVGDDYSFSGEGYANGLFIRCKGGNNSFGYTTEGEFIDCLGNDYSFASDYSGLAGGNYTNCIGGDYSFGGNFGDASGNFTNCVAGDYSFGTYTSAGKFFNCKSGDYGFSGFQGNANGVFENCSGKIISFGSQQASGKFTNCIGGEMSFASVTSPKTCDGIFINCVGGEGSFALNGTASGVFTNCVGGDRSFGGQNASVSGVFTNCLGGEFSFASGGSGALTGFLYFCRLTSGTFETVSGGGRTVYCIDGNNNTNNQ